MSKGFWATVLGVAIFCKVFFFDVPHVRALPTARELASSSYLCNPLFTDVLLRSQRDLMGLKRDRRALAAMRRLESLRAQVANCAGINPSTGRNLIKNPGFENGLLRWKRSGSVRVSAQRPFSGHRALELSSQPNGSVLILQQGVSIPVGRDVYAAVMVRSTGIINEPIVQLSRDRTDGRSEIIATLQPEEAGSGKGWIVYQAFVKGSTEGGSIQFRILAPAAKKNRDWSFRVWIDDAFLGLAAEPTPTPSPSPEVAAVPTETSTALPGATNTRLAASTGTPAVTDTPTATTTPTPFSAPSSTPTRTATRTPSTTPTPPTISTSSPTRTRTPTPVAAATGTPTRTPSPSPSPSRTPTRTPTGTNTAIFTGTPTAPPLNTATPTRTFSPSPSPSPTRSPTSTATSTPTPGSAPREALVDALKGLWSSKACMHKIRQEQIHQFDFRNDQSPPFVQALAYAQIPGYPEYFVGRVSTDPAANRGSYDQWFLGLFRLEGKKFVYQHPLLLDRSGTTRISIPGSRLLNTAYDPDVVSHNGKLWVSFECGGPSGFNDSAGTCIGALQAPAGNPAAWAIDPSSVRLLVLGGITETTPSILYTSASVPRLFVHRNALYLYWIAVRISATGQFLTLRTRGIDLSVHNNNWTTGFGVGASEALPIAAHDARAYDVWTPGSAADDNSMATAFQILSDNDSVYMLGAVGGGGCTLPTDPINGCYRLTVSRSATPLGTGIFNQERVLDGLFPPNFENYGSLINLNDGSVDLFGFFGMVPQRSDQFNMTDIAGFTLREFNGETNPPLRKEGWIKEVYARLTGGAAPSASELDLWSGYHATLPPDTFGLMMGSAGIGNAIVNQIYTVYLGRSADAAALQVWGPILKQSGYLEVVRGVTGSAEFAGLNRPDFYRDRNWQINNFVQSAYERILGHAPDSAGAGYWYAVMNSTAGAGDWRSVVFGLAYSQEFWGILQSATRCP